MKKTNILYWIFTALFAGLMLFSAIPNIMVDKNSVTMVHDQMGFPTYMIPFLGWAKLLGVIGILVPGFPRIKEWAYAGLLFDLVGAIYSFLALGTPVTSVLPMFIFVGFAFASYYFYHKRLRMQSNGVVLEQKRKLSVVNPITQEA